MKIPARLEPLFNDKLFQEVVVQLKSGKEAEVYIVRANEELICAKVYKEAIHRSFKHMTAYTDGRNVRNTRDQRAMNKKSRYGRQENEIEWQSNEVDALRILASAGVRVPKVYNFVDGVLLMEIICDAEGSPAPRLNQIELSREQALEFFPGLIREVVRMLCAGIVHGDLSEFNILLSDEGPVIIDLPQAVQATANNAFAMLERDISNLKDYFSQFAPEIAKTDFAKEIWNLYKNGRLKPDTELTGKYQPIDSIIDLGEVIEAIDGVKEDELVRLGVIPRRKDRV